MCSVHRTVMPLCGGRHTSVPCVGRSTPVRDQIISKGGTVSARDARNGSRTGAPAKAAGSARRSAAASRAVRPAALVPPPAAVPRRRPRRRPTAGTRTASSSARSLPAARLAGVLLVLAARCRGRGGLPDLPGGRRAGARRRDRLRRRAGRAAGPAGAPGGRRHPAARRRPEVRPGLRGRRRGAGPRPVADRDLPRQQFHHASRRRGDRRGAGADQQRRRRRGLGPRRGRARRWSCSPASWPSVAWGRTVMDDSGALDPVRSGLAGAAVLLGVATVLCLALPAADVPDTLVTDPATGLETVVTQEGPQALLERPGLALLGGLLLAGAVVLCSVIAPSLRPRLAAVGGLLAITVAVLAAALTGLRDAASSADLDWTLPGAGLRADRPRLRRADRAGLEAPPKPPVTPATPRLLKLRSWTNASGWSSPSRASTGTTVAPRSWRARSATRAWRSSTPACTRRRSRSSRPSSRRTPTPSVSRCSPVRT